MSEPWLISEFPVHCLVFGGMLFMIFVLFFLLKLNCHVNTTSLLHTFWGWRRWGSWEQNWKYIVSWSFILNVKNLPVRFTEVTLQKHLPTWRKRPLLLCSTNMKPTPLFVSAAKSANLTYSPWKTYSWQHFRSLVQDRYHIRNKRNEFVVGAVAKADWWQLSKPDYFYCKSGRFCRRQNSIF